MRIGEVSQHAGISTRMLRHYDAIGLVSPSGRTAGGYRAYSPGDVRRLFEVESLRALGLPLGEVKAVLDDPRFAPSALVDDLATRTRRRIARDEELLRRLEHVRASEPADWGDVLRLVALLRGLDSAQPARRQQVVLTAPDGERLPAASLAEALLDESDPNVAGALQWALARSRGDALSVLEAALDPGPDLKPGAPDRQARRRTVATIARLGTDEAHVALTRLLGHPDDDVRGRAAIALGAAGTAAALPELVRMIVRGDDDVEAAEVVGALARRHDLADQVARTIDDELRRPDATAAQRSRLAQALAELDGTAAAEVLSALADDPDDGVRRIAAYCTRARAPRDR